MASFGTESVTAADDGAAAVDHQGGQGLESDWKVPPAPVAAGAFTFGVPGNPFQANPFQDGSLRFGETIEAKRHRMKETQRRMEETQRNLAAQMAAVEAEEARIEQEQRMAEEKKHPPPRMVVRDILDYKHVQAPPSYSSLTIEDVVTRMIQDGYSPLDFVVSRNSADVQIMVKYGPPRYETPYTWKKAEEASREAIAFGEAIAAEEARRKAKDAAK